MQNTCKDSLAVVAGMKKPNNHAEPTKNRTLKKRIYKTIQGQTLVLYMYIKKKLCTQLPRTEYNERPFNQNTLCFR